MVREIYEVVNQALPFLFVIVVLDGSSCVFGSRVKILNIDKNVNTTTKLTKLTRYLFNAEASTNCHSLSFEWKVSNVTSRPFSVGRASSITIGSGTDLDDISSLGVGIYLVEFTAHFRKFYFLDYGFIEVLPSAPVAFIAGGPEVSREHNSNITLDGSPSRDFDIGKGLYKGLTFEWSCKGEEEMFHDESDSSNRTVIGRDAASRGCFGNEEQKLKDTGRIVFLDTSSMQIKKYYDIKLTIKKRDLSGTFVQRVEIVDGTPLYAEIE